MPLPVIDAVDRITIRWTDTVTGQFAYNVFHVRENTPATSSVLAGRILSRMTAAMWSWVASSSRIDQISVLPLDGVSSSYVATVAAAAGTTGGSGSATPLPAVAGLISLATGFRGPAKRGRIYLPNVAEAEVSGQVLQDVAAVQTAWNTFIANLTTDANPLGVASYVHAAFDPVLTLRAESIVATQRRRVHR